MGPERVFSSHFHVVPTATCDNTHGTKNRARKIEIPLAFLLTNSATASDITRKLVVPVRINWMVFHSTLPMRGSWKRYCQLRRPTGVGVGAIRSHLVNV